MTTQTMFDEVVKTLVTTLGIDDRAAALDRGTPLLGSLPELDSMAVAELLTSFEEQFGIDIDDADLDNEVFETLGSLVDFVDEHRR